MSSPESMPVQSPVELERLPTPEEQAVTIAVIDPESMDLVTGPIDNPEDYERKERTKRRNQALEAILDPEGTLPGITLDDQYVRHPKLSQTSGIDTHHYNVKDESGNEVGWIALRTPYGKKAERPGATARVTGVNLVKGKGFGKAAYLAILQKLPSGVELAPDNSVSPDALMIWQWLEENGLAEIGEDGLPTPTTDDKGGLHYNDLDYRTCLSELERFAEANSKV